MSSNSRYCLALCVSMTIGATYSVSEPPRGQQPEKKAIRLETAYSSDGQKGMQSPWDSKVENARAVFGRFTLDNIKNGSSTVFLVRGDDVVTAMVGTLQVFLERNPVDQPVNVYPPDEPVRAGSIPKSNEFWVVAYFGTAEAGPVWQVTRVSVAGNAIRVVYRRNEFANNALKLHFVWIPLGNLPEGTYKLELHDDGQHIDTLTRQVVIPKRPNRP